jgi:hypothetical protein
MTLQRAIDQSSPRASQGQLVVAVVRDDGGYELCGQIVMLYLMESASGGMKNHYLKETNEKRRETGRLISVWRALGKEKAAAAFCCI